MLWSRRRNHWRRQWFLFERMLNYITPDYVHVMFNGRVVKSGGKELAFELEEKGYEWLKPVEEENGVSADV